MNVNATAMNKKRTVVVHTRSNNGLFLLPFEILLWVCVVSFNRARINELFERWWFWDLSWFFISWSKLWMNFSVDRILRFFKMIFLILLFFGQIGIQKNTKESFEFWDLFFNLSAKFLFIVHLRQTIPFSSRNIFIEGQIWFSNCRQLHRRHRYQTNINLVSRSYWSL